MRRETGNGEGRRGDAMYGSANANAKSVGSEVKRGGEEGREKREGGSRAREEKFDMNE